MLGPAEIRPRQRLQNQRDGLFKFAQQRRIGRNLAFTVSLKLESLLLFPAAATKRISGSELIAFSSAFFKIWYHAGDVFLRSSTSLSRRDPRQVHLLCIPRECAVSSGYTGPGVVFDQVFKAFGAHQVLRNVSFCVPAGEALCILGRSGTGKSVTPKCSRTKHRRIVSACLLSIDGAGRLNCFGP